MHAMTLPASDHFNGKTFFQPGSHPERLFRDFLKWRFTSRPARWPKTVTLVPQPAPPVPRAGELVATWLGHATFLVQSNAGNVLFDPVFSERVSPFTWAGPRRVHPNPIPLDALPRIDVVCVSHDHYDHFDAATLAALARRTPAPVFVAPLRHRDLLKRCGAEHIAELDWWQAYETGTGLRVTLTPTKHWSNRLGTPRNHRLWGGFWTEFSILDSGFSIEAGPTRDGSTQRSQRESGDGGSIIENRPSKIENTAAPRRGVWFVGDSGYDQPLFREIRRRLGAPDVALVPIGAYEPRWFMAPMHMNPEEAVRLHRDVEARVSLAMHWGTFRLTDEGRDEPVRALEAARTEAGVKPDEFRVLAPGESVVI
jgi:L-ascorbate metabolism protein UlaG (beta-lactamase superfamily)